MVDNLECVEQLRDCHGISLEKMSAIYNVNNETFDKSRQYQKGPIKYCKLKFHANFRNASMKINDIMTRGVFAAVIASIKISHTRIRFKEISSTTIVKLTALRRHLYNLHSYFVGVILIIIIISIIIIVVVIVIIHTCAQCCQAMLLGINNFASASSARLASGAKQGKSCTERSYSFERWLLILKSISLLAVEILSKQAFRSTNSQSLEEPYGVLFVRWKMNTLKLSSVISQTFVGHFSWFQADVVGKCRKFLKIMHVRLSKASGAILND
ncbi:hypothetical protein T03_14549 [Trichinella britovi]|uniref:Uncharacterized protein n=1 Tax=Trichinella britovi TaxID=45882 RepID=A0A0V1CBE1_TRIBR|nr:hypothetical protein T03_14549 [Trichinella britovi]